MPAPPPPPARPAPSAAHQLLAATAALAGLYLIVFVPGIVVTLRSIAGTRTPAVATRWPARVAALEWDAFAVLVVLGVVCRWLPAHAPDVAARMRTGRRLRRPVPGGTAGAAAIFVAIAVLGAWLGDHLAALLHLTRGTAPQVGDGTGGFVTGVAAAGAAAVTEELTLLALAAALAEHVAARRGAPRGRAVAGTVALLIVLRWLVHLYYLGASGFVLVWVPPAYALYRWAGSIVPLVIGHAGYDCLAVAGHAYPALAPVTDRALWLVGALGIAALGIAALGGTSFGGPSFGSRVRGNGAPGVDRGAVPASAPTRSETA